MDEMNNDTFHIRCEFSVINSLLITHGPDNRRAARWPKSIHHLPVRQGADLQSRAPDAMSIATFGQRVGCRMQQVPGSPDLATNNRRVHVR